MPSETAPDGHHDPHADPVPAGSRPAVTGRRTVLLGLLLGVAAIVGAVGASALIGGDEPGEDLGGRQAQMGDTQDAGLGPVSGAESQPLPDGSLEAMGDGESIDPASYRGQPLVVNFWATWCAPCVAEMPELQRVHEAVADDVAFLGVNLQDDTEAAQGFVDELGITYDLATDDGDYFAAVQGYGMPTTLLVDAGGTVRYRHTGALDGPELRDLLADHLDVG